MSSEQTKDSVEKQPKQQNLDDKTSTSSKSSTSSKASNQNEAKTTSSTNKESTRIQIPSQSNETNQHQQRNNDAVRQENIAEESSPPECQHDGANMQYIIWKWPLRFDPVAILFALLVFVGGLIGYITKNSSQSLVAGTIFAFLIAVGIYYDGARRNPFPLLTTLLSLAGVMFWRYSDKWAFMPSGLITLLAALLFARHTYLLYLRGQTVNT